MSVRSKVTAAFAMCISLPLMAGMGALWLGTESTLRQTAGEELQASTRAAMSGIESRIGSNLTHLKAWSSLPVMQDVLIGDDGNELSRTLSDLNLAYPEFAALIITNAQGTVVATTDAAERNVDLSANEGVHAAISGRDYQSKFSIHRVGGPESIWFTVPVVANYDRQTVIGTLTGVLDLAAIAKNVAAQSPLGLEGRYIILTEQSTGRIIYSPRENSPLFETLTSTETRQNSLPREVFLSNEPYLATSAQSKGQAMLGDPGLATFGVAPSTSVFAAVDKLSNIFFVVAGLAAAASLVIAWHWSTPLVRLSAVMSRVAHGDALVSSPTLPSHHTFAPMANAVDSLREAAFARDRLLVREKELVRAKEEAEAQAREQAEQVEQLGHALKHQINEILELSDLINKENLAAVSGKLHISYARELSISGTKLMTVIEDALVKAQSVGTNVGSGQKRLIA